MQGSVPCAYTAIIVGVMFDAGSGSSISACSSECSRETNEKERIIQTPLVFSRKGVFSAWLVQQEGDPIEHTSPG